MNYFFSLLPPLRQVSRLLHRPPLPSPSLVFEQLEHPQTLPVNQFEYSGGKFEPSRHRGRYWVGTFETRPDATTPQGTTAGIDLAHDIHKVWFYSSTWLTER